MYCSSKQTDLDICLQMCGFAINTSIQGTTKFSPFFLIYGRQAKLPLEISLKPAKYSEEPLDFD